MTITFSFDITMNVTTFVLIKLQVFIILSTLCLFINY